MITKAQDALSFARDLNLKFGSGFCLAKWKHLSLYLHLGQGHSCYHPRPQKIPLAEIAKSPSSLHNTAEKLANRKLMQEGRRPEECSYCWAIEDLKTDQLSDRFLKTRDESGGNWNVVEQVFKKDWREHEIPSYIEVSFSNKCNFKCMYCNPKASSLWEDEIKRHGVYREISNDFRIDVDILPEDNAYVDAFWKWWPELTRELKALRITGGEPLLHRKTFEILETLQVSEAPSLHLMVNSNLGVPHSTVKKFSSQIQNLRQQGKLSGFCLFTSLESTGKRAEFVRYGLNFELWRKNVHEYLTTTTADLSLMCTYNLLSVTGFTDFLKLFLELRESFPGSHRHKRIRLDVPYLEHPTMFHFTLLGPEFHRYLEESIAFMRANFSDSDPAAFDSLEIAQLERMLNLWRDKPIQGAELFKNTGDFSRFMSQYEIRRRLNFKETFPELAGFYEAISVK